MFRWGMSSLEYRKPIVQRIAAATCGYGASYVVDLSGQAVAVFTTGSMFHLYRPLRWSLFILLIGFLVATYLSPNAVRTMIIGLLIWIANQTVYHVAVRSLEGHGYDSYSQVHSAISFFVTPVSLAMFASGVAVYLLRTAPTQ